MFGWQTNISTGNNALIRRLRATRLHAICSKFSSATPLRRNFTGESLLPIHCGGELTWRLQTLAIETSCDDTSVAVLSISRKANSLRLCSDVLFHEKVTANSHSYNGIHPLVALDSHRAELAGLVQRAVQQLIQHSASKGRTELNSRHPITPPDFITVTRGPGMRSNLDVGLNTAKGLSLAWNIPLVGVNHMQAHALTPRLCATIDASNANDHISRGMASDVQSKDAGWSPDEIEPRFPFLSLLVSGGHTMLIQSKSLSDHRTLAETVDIAIGNYLDKVAKFVLNESEMTTPYGKALEDFAFPQGAREFSSYQVPNRRCEEMEKRPTAYGWSLTPPLSQSLNGEKSSRRMIYSFSGLLTSIPRLGNPSDMSDQERRELAREAQRVAFEHLGSRVLLHLEQRVTAKDAPITVVVSGGVASNQFLKHVLSSMLHARGYSNTTLLFPPPELCTDNALMIAWAGMEMYDAGYQSELCIGPLRKWSMDPLASDGGILGVEGWRRNG